ncbi:MAG: HAD family phosphatase [Phycisphaerae bacterium]|nr:HAD family phosphatase [Phycisphaerae bacterium]
MTRSIQAVIFDLGRVIVDVNIARLAEHLGTVLTEGDPVQTISRMMSDPLVVQYDKGRVTPEQFHADLCHRFGLKVPFSQFSRLWCDIFSPIPGMEDLLRSLHGRIPLGLLSDTDALHWQYIRDNFPILSIFPHPVLSFQVGTMKPDPDIFRRAADSVHTSPENCLYIDDLPANVEGARRIGMEAIMFRGADSLRKDLFSRNILP